MDHFAARSLGGEYKLAVPRLGDVCLGASTKRYSNESKIRTRNGSTHEFDPQELTLHETKPLSSGGVILRYPPQLYNRIAVGFVQRTCYAKP